MKSTISDMQTPAGRKCVTLYKKDSGPRGAIQSTPETKTIAEDLESEDLLCRQCLFGITRESSRISVNGAHCHTLANPHGIVYEIGCFKTAAGCSPSGRPTIEFSWFPPHSWQVALCGACRSHLGWRFSSTENTVFYGLILDRIVKAEF